ncbi:MAG: hypothetical protein D6815_03805, partial [Candidatus Dadabacteria bacterium]
MFILRSGVGLASCDPCVCDADGSGRVSATDALAVLKLAVGQPIGLQCDTCAGVGVRREDIRSLAKAIYDRVDAGRSLSATEVSQIFESFSVATVASSDGAGFQAALDAGQPPLLDFQAAAIGTAMAYQTLMPVDSFLTAMGSAGAALASSGSPLSAAALGAELLPIAEAQSYSGDQVLPALVIALGRERARRAGGSNDPVWGDGMLDALQTALLLYEIEYSALSPAAPPMIAASPQANRMSPAPLVRGTSRGEAPGHPAADAPQPQAVAVNAGTTPPVARGIGSALPTLSPLIPKVIRGQIGSRIGKLIDFPIGWTSSIGATICASVVLYSYQMTLDVVPDLITRRRPDENTEYRTTASAHLEFDFQQDVNSLPKQIGLFIGSCNLPPKGPASKPIEWSIDASLADHGALVQKDASTDVLGNATATYQAVDEIVPKELRAFALQDTATGNVWVKATDLMPTWKTFELAVRPLVNGNGGRANHILQVQYYHAPRLTFVMQSDIHVHYDTGQDYYSTVSTNVRLKPPADSSGILKYEASGRTVYDSFHLTDTLHCDHAVGYAG